MTIACTCPCGRQISAPEKYAGKRVKCPACGQPLTVPRLDDDDFGLSSLDGGAAAAAIAPAVAGGMACPACSVAVAPGAVICIDCGYNFREGRQTARSSELVYSATNVRIFSAVAAAVCFILAIACLMLVFEMVGAIVPLAILVAAGAALVTVALTASTKYTVDRQSDTAIYVAKFYHVGPFTIPVKTVNAADYESVWHVQGVWSGSQQIWLIILILGLLACGFIPGMMVWWMLFTQEDSGVNYRVEFRPKRGRAAVIFRGGENDKHDSREIANMLHRATGLPKEEELNLRD